MNHHVSYQTLWVVALVCLLSVGCSTNTNNEHPAAKPRTELNKAGESSNLLEDGVYPVVLDEAPPKSDAKIEIVELPVVPVAGNQESAPGTIRVIARPLLRFRNVSHFDFTFEENECTEIAFQNTDELEAYTRDHIGSRLAVVIDNKVITHHKIREAIVTDRVRITCCTVGGGDHLHKHLTALRQASDDSRQAE